VLAVDDLRLDRAAHAVWRADVEVQLSTKEFMLLELFMRRPREVEKIDRPFGCASLETVRGAGYRLRASGEP
jgi:two-component system OmpR family response regulator